MLESRSAGRAAADMAARPAPRSPRYDPGIDYLARSAVRETRRSSYATTLDRDKAYYVDAGGWGVRADEILLNNRQVSLVVLGHTHQACMLEVSRGRSLFWMHPHAPYYLTSGCCLPAAQALARRLPGARAR